VILRSSTATGNRERKRNPSYSLRCLLLSLAIWLKHELGNRPKDVDLRFRASLRSQLFGWLVGWLVPVIIPAYTGYEDGTGCSETSARKICLPGKCQRGRI